VARLEVLPQQVLPVMEAAFFCAAEPVDTVQRSAMNIGVYPDGPIDHCSPPPS
jgi:hypothetical protein